LAYVAALTLLIGVGGGMHWLICPVLAYFAWPCTKTTRLPEKGAVVLSRPSVAGDVVDYQSETTRKAGVRSMSDKTSSSTMRPHLEEIQAHYDISDQFFELFLDPTKTYSCGYFEPANLMLEQAQIAKIDLNLDKLGLKQGMTLLDIGCGWGSVMKRAMEKYDVNVIGLTLSNNQHAYCEQLLAKSESKRSRRVLLRGWEEFDEPVDRIVSVEAFEHFGFERYDAFFTNTYNLMPDDGVMTIQSTCGYHPYEMHEKGLVLSFAMCRFVKFIVTEIFPGGRIPSATMVVDHATKAGYTVPEVLSLREHYVKTLGIWSATLKAHKDEAIALKSEEVYERYMKYLTGCQGMFEQGYADVGLFTITK
jgi:cyclopropane-fatty-acyl-phospholipid synthase